MILFKVFLKLLYFFVVPYFRQIHIYNTYRKTYEIINTIINFITFNINKWNYCCFVFICFFHGINTTFLWFI